MIWSRKYGARRSEVRKNRPDASSDLWARMRANGVAASLGIAAIFFVVATGIMLLREHTVAYRPGQTLTEDVYSRVKFVIPDKDLLTKAQNDARAAAPRVYFFANGVPWTQLEQSLLALPDDVRGKTYDQLPENIRRGLGLRSDDQQALTQLHRYELPDDRTTYNEQVKAYVSALRRLDLDVVPADQWSDEHGNALRQDALIETLDERDADTAKISGRKFINRSTNKLYPDRGSQELDRLFEVAAAPFRALLRPAIVNFTLDTLQPTHTLNDMATAEAQNRAAELVAADSGNSQVAYAQHQLLFHKGHTITEKDWQVLRAEKAGYIANLDRRIYKQRAGLAVITLMMTLVLAYYIGRYQPKIIRNHARAGAIAALLLSMLLVAQLAAMGTGPIYFYGLAPTILVAMILTIAYDQRFALGVASMHGILASVALEANIGFFVILWVGCFVCCLLLNEVRSRSKLIEVGGLTALAMMAAALAAGAVAMDPKAFIITNCLYAGASGLAVGFVVLGILPFIEKSFRMTTSMTLLELADASQPLLRRLSLEAPGTYNHSLQVATLAEAAAESIGANSLLCRVAAYYHDIGKINKADYFVENQIDGRNRHLNLSPSVSLLIILGHVKDGVEIAKEYNLPTVIHPFIQQHHGTTLVEYFYHQACNQKDQKQPDLPAISETQYRYPGPRPRSKETAILMMADCVESAVRAMSEPNPARIESLVHELAMKRLLDGQFDECDLTLKEIERIERACVKTLLGIYHGRIAYPSSATASIPAASMAVKSA